LAPSSKIILTRPAQESRQWIEGIESAGYSAINWALIELIPIALQKNQIKALGDLSAYVALIFVSTAAVEHFFKSFNVSARLSVPGLTFWATGPGTAQSLKIHGIPSTQIISPSPAAPQFDSPQLWAVASQLVGAGEKVLIIRGSDSHPLDAKENQPQPIAENITPSGSQWLISQLTQNGVLVDEIEVYQRRAPQWSEEQKEAALGAIGEGSIWVFSSSLSLHNLGQILPHQDWSKGRALATHKRIAQTAIDMGWGVVHESRPTLSDVLTSLKSIH